MLGNDELGISFVDIASSRTIDRLDAHTSVVNALVISPDGRYALSGGADTFIVLSDLASGTEVRRFVMPSRASVNSLAFAPDGRLFASGQSDGSIIWWDTQRADPLVWYQGHQAAVMQVRFSPDGVWLYSTGQDGTLRQWPRAPEKPDEWLDWTAANRYVRPLSADERAYYDLRPEDVGTAGGSAPPLAPEMLAPELSATRTPVPEPEAVARDAGEAQPGENRGTLAAGEADVWRHVGRQGEMVALFAEADHPSTGVSDPAEQLRRGLLDTRLIVRDADRAVLAENDDADGSRDADARLDFIPPADGAYQVEVRGARAGAGGAYTLVVQPIRLVRERTHVALATGIWGVAISPDGSLVLGCPGGRNLFLPEQSPDLTAILWSLDPEHGLAQRYRLEAVDGHQASAVSVAFSPDGKTMLSSSWDSSAVPWDVATGKDIRRFSHQTVLVESVTFSPDGSTFLSTSFDGTVRLWDVGTGREIRRFAMDAPGNWSVAFSPNGTTVAGGSFDGSVYQWDLRTGAAISRFPIHDTLTRSLLYTPDGRHIISSDDRGQIVEWDAATGRETTHYPGSIGVRPGAEPNTLVSDINLIDLETGQIIRRFQGGHLGDMMLVDVSPDGQYLLTGDTTGRLILWDYAAGEVVRYFTGHTTTIWTAFFSPDGQTAYSSAYEYAVRQWRVAEWSLEELLDWVAENRYLREFTCDEREEYDIDPLCECEDLLVQRCAAVSTCLRRLLVSRHGVARLAPLGTPFSTGEIDNSKPVAPTYIT